MSEKKVIPYLVTENSFLVSALVSDWFEKFGPGTIALRASRPDNGQDRIKFHQAHVGKRELSAAEFEELKQLYGGITDSEKALLERAGVPKLADNLYEPGVINFIGDDLNASTATEWLKKGNNEGARFLLSCIQMLKSEAWLNIAADGRVYNVHSAVLPFAAGMFAIENVAIMRNAKRFEASAGATLHYVNPGVDAGQVIKIARLEKPFNYKSIWDLKAASYQAAFEMLIELGENAVKNSVAWRPASRVQDFSLRLHEPFKKKDFTLEKRAEAVASYSALCHEQASLPAVDDKIPETHRFIRG